MARFVDDEWRPVFIFGTELARIIRRLTRHRISQQRTEVVVSDLMDPNQEFPMDALERIKQQVSENPVIVYMKGSPDFPQCGFSARTVQALNACGVEYAYVNIYEDEEIYRALPKFANWPTFPQLYVKGELVGGCDITLDLYQTGELKKMLEEAVGRKAAA